MKRAVTGTAQERYVHGSTDVYTSVLLCNPTNGSLQHFE